MPAPMAYRAAGQLRCPAPPTEGLTPEQLFALHRFKHLVLSETYGLYMIVPPDRADPIIKLFFDSLVLDGDPDTPPAG